MSCLTEADLLAAGLDDDAEENGVDATYYPQVLTGHDTDSQERDPSEEDGVSVTGFISEEEETAEDGVLATSAVFTLPYSAGLGFTPHANDRLVIEGMSYRVKEKKVQRFGSSPAGWTLTLESEGTVE